MEGYASSCANALVSQCFCLRTISMYCVFVRYVWYMYSWMSGTDSRPGFSEQQVFETLAGKLVSAAVDSYKRCSIMLDAMGIRKRTDSQHEATEVSE